MFCTAERAGITFVGSFAKHYCISENLFDIVLRKIPFNLKYTVTL